MTKEEPFSATFKLNKETKNTIRYAEEAEERRPRVSEDATQLVLKQAERSTENGVVQLKRCRPNARMSSPTRRSSPCNTAPQMCRSTNRRSSVAEPEVWFRIVHITLDCHGTLVAAHREQTVEIALGPADRVVSAVPQRRTTPITPTVPKTPRVVELLRKAIE